VVVCFAASCQAVTDLLRGRPLQVTVVSCYCYCTVVVCFAASCQAVTDLLRGRPLDDIVQDLPAVWETCFRVRDDIKV